MKAGRPVGAARSFWALVDAINALQAPQTTGSLARVLGITERNTRRHLDTLRQAGWVTHFDRDLKRFHVATVRIGQRLPEILSRLGVS